MFELHTGTTEISYNTLEAGIAGAADAIFFMTYDGIDVTALQNVSYNTFNMGTGSVFDYAHRSGAISINTPGAAYGVTDAKFTNVVIQGNTINNLKSYRRGIGFWNGGGGGGGIIAPLVKSNTITGTTGSTESYGIFFVATGSAPNAATNPTVINNMIYNCAYGIYLRTAGCAPGAQIHYNNVAGNTVGLDNTVGPSDVDARFNWWGSATGPTYSSNPGGTGDDISGNVDYSPWLGNTFEVTPRTYHVNPTGTIQEAIDEATSGDTILVHDGTYYEHLVVNKPLTITSASSPIIDGGASGYCITVSANNVVISGFEIRNGYLGISIQNAIGTQVCNNRVIDFIKGGIVARGAKNIFIEGNNISTTLHDEAPNGIDIGTYSGTTGIVRGNRISGCSWKDFTGDYETSWSGSGILVIESGDSLEIIGNTVHDCDVGMDIESDLMNITYNEMYDNVYGFVFWNANPKVNYNNIYSNTQYGVYRTAGGDLTGVLDACYNWWGDPTGPYHPELNPSGKGDQVSDNVDFEPWLIEPYPPPIPVETILYIDPAKVEYWTPAYNKVFPVAIKIANVTDLCLYEFKLYWNTTLLDFAFSDINETWRPEYRWEEVNEALGEYKVKVCAIGEQPGFNGSKTLVEVFFKIKYDPIYPEDASSILNLNETKLGDSTVPIANEIVHMVHDGEYHCYSTRPKVKAGTYTSKRFGDTFEIAVYVENVVNLYDFEFSIFYNTTLLDAQSVVLGPFLKAPTTIYRTIIDDAYNSTHGLVRFAAKSIPAAPPANGTGVLAIITFKVTLASIWPEPNLECSLSVKDTHLKTIGGKVVPHDEVDGLYRYVPIPGDINTDGTVNLDDLYIIALAFDSEPGDTNWNKHVDLKRDGIIDTFDLRVAAWNFGRDC